MTASANDVKHLLQTIQEIGAVSVTRSQDCAGYQWEVDWFYGGNQLPISVKFILWWAIKTMYIN